MRCRLHCLAVVAMLGGAPAGAASEPGTFSLLFENDVFFKGDQDYTNGLQLAFATPPEQSPATVVSIARALPFFADAGTVLVFPFENQSNDRMNHRRRRDPIKAKTSLHARKSTAGSRIANTDCKLLGSVVPGSP